MTRRQFVAFLAAFMLPSMFYCSDWILAAEAFSVVSDSNFESFSLVAQQLPKLILEELSSSPARTPSLVELQQRRLAELQEERSALVKKLGVAVKARDQILVSSGLISDRSLDRKLAERQSEIDTLRLQLEENATALDSLHTEIETGLGDTEYSARFEDVVLWKRDSSMLFSVAENASLEKKISDEKINGLITGNIVAFGNYVSVEAHLVLYPGGIVTATARGSGSLADIVSMARTLAEQLQPAIVNSLPVELSFMVLPEAASEKAIVVLDDKVFPLHDIEGGVVVSSGVHSVTVESEGYYDKSFTWDFSGEPAFVATVQLEPRQALNLYLEEEAGVSGEVYINGLPVGAVPLTVQSERGMLLGEFEPTSRSSADKGSSFFVLDIEPDADLAQVNARLKAETSNISARIEKRRRSMYNSYSALIVSLIPTVFSYGMYVTTYNGWAQGVVGEDTANIWKNISTGSIVLSVGLGVNFLVQLGRYIAAVDAVLPENIPVED